jgi:hypothetical protein
MGALKLKAVTPKERAPQTGNQASLLTNYTSGYWNEDVDTTPVQIEVVDLFLSCLAFTFRCAGRNLSLTFSRVQTGLHIRV